MISTAKLYKNQLKANEKQYKQQQLQRNQRDHRQRCFSITRNYSSLNDINSRTVNNRNNVSSNIDIAYQYIYLYLLFLSSLLLTSSSMDSFSTLNVESEIAFYWIEGPAGYWRAVLYRPAQEVPPSNAFHGFGKDCNCKEPLGQCGCPPEILWDIPVKDNDEDDITEDEDTLPLMSEQRELQEDWLLSEDDCPKDVEESLEWEESSGQK